MHKHQIKYFFIAFLLIKSNFVYSEPWYSTDDQILHLEIEQLRLCGVEVPANSSFPLNISIIDLAIKNSNYIDSSEACQQFLYAFKTELEKNLYNSKNIIGFQSKRPDIYFQDFGKRLTGDSHVYMSSSKSGINYAYKLSIQALSDEYRFDESYLSFYYNNHVFTVGRISKWWSPSFNSSLILSNSARPSPGISFSNYHPKVINSKYLSFLGPISYEFFINRLESDRYISNALLFGNRISIQPNQRFKVSLLRAAQFGGEGRKLNSRIFFDMLRGNDNYDSSFSSKDDEPGNQLGGLDFNLLLLKNKNISLYGQIIGEDESGYLPSATFYSLGVSYSWDKITPNIVNLEYSDTGSKGINSTYNHSIYQSGYRYFEDPIGSAFGADSKSVSLNYKKVFKSSESIHFRVIKASLNSNNSDTFFINGVSDDLDLIELSYQKRILRNFHINFKILHTNFTKIDTYDNLSTVGTIEYIW